MTPLDRSTHASGPAGGDTSRQDPFEAWTIQKGYESAARIRLPAIFATQRLKLGSRRCDELQRDRDDLKDRLLNAPARTPADQIGELERRLLQIESALHAERLTVWRDLVPLAREMRDAAIDDMRTAFLDEFTRLMDGRGDGGR